MCAIKKKDEQAVQILACAWDDINRGKSVFKEGVKELRDSLVFLLDGQNI